MSLVSFSAIRDRQARLLFAAQLLSQFGDKLMLIGLLWFLTKHGTASVVSWYLGLSALPHLLTMPFAARWIGKLGGELRTVIVTDVARGVLLLAFAGALGTLTATQAVPAIFAVSFLLNLFASLFNPAMFSLPSRLAGEDADRQRVTALLESCVSLSAVLAPLLATALYAALGILGLVALNAVSYLVAAILEARVSLPAPVEPAQAAEDAPALAGGFDPAITTMLGCFFAMNLFLGPVLVFLPLFAQNVFGGNLGALAALETGLGFGTVVGTLGLSVLPLPGRVWQRTSGALLAVAVCYLSFALSHSLVAGVVAICLLGFFLAVANVAILGFFQARPEVVRLMTWVNLISVASLPVSMSLVGVVLVHWELRQVALACAVSLLGVTVVSTAAMVPRPARQPKGIAT